VTKFRHLWLRSDIHREYSISIIHVTYAIDFDSLAVNIETHPLKSLLVMAFRFANKYNHLGTLTEMIINMTITRLD